jgi:hypothetical protein
MFGDALKENRSGLIGYGRSRQSIKQSSLVSVDLTGDTPAAHQLTWTIDTQARKKLEEETFGKRVLITDRDDWPIAEGSSLFSVGYLA